MLKVALLKIALLHGCFSCFLNYTNGTKSGKGSHMGLVHFASHCKNDNEKTLNGTRNSN